MKRNTHKIISIDQSIPETSLLLEREIHNNRSVDLTNLKNGVFKIHSVEKYGSYIKSTRYKFYISGNIKRMNSNTQITYRVWANELFQTLSVVVPLQCLLIPAMILIPVENRTPFNVTLTLGVYVLFSALFIFWMSHLASQQKQKATSIFEQLISNIQSDDAQ